jgi:hypothetical protein
MYNKEDLHYLMGTNMIAYVKLKGISEEEIEFTEDGKIKYWFKKSDDLFEAIREFKEDEKINDYIKIQNEIKANGIKRQK